MTTRRENGSTYCMAAHSMIAHMQKVPADVLEPLRNDAAISDPKLQALQVFTMSVHETRGNMTEADLEAFLAAGYSKGNILEVILGAGLKTMLNDTNHIAETPLDSLFQANTWAPNTSAAA